MNAIPFEKIADTPAFPGEYEIVTRSVADDGTLLFLFVELEAKDAVFGTDHRPTARFVPTRMNAPTRFRLVGVRNDWHYIVDLPLLDLAYPLVDVFPDGRVLLVGRRCQWRNSEDFDLNGVICDPASGRTSNILLGDGINRVYIDRRGLIWVAYFDEGVFGNYGWGGPGPRPIGAAGLVCFSDNGEKVWEFLAGQIADCYALNVSGTEAVAYYYTDFPICRVSSYFRVTHWRTELRGCRELAVTRSRVLLSGQYDDPPGTGYLGTLDGDALKGVEKVRMLLPDGSQLPEHSLLARGRHIYYFDASSVYRSTLA